jgi:AcrR family transcriptional regulator
MAKVPQPKAVRTRDKDAKIASIMAATLRLIERDGYENVTSRDIAGESGVSNGLVFKYFPGGKPAIVRALSLKIMREILELHMPVEADFDDFPGFLRATFSRVVAYGKKNRRIFTAITIASLTDKEVFEDIEETADYDETALPSFFSQFREIGTGRIRQQPEFVGQWLEVTNAVILHHLMYPSAFATDENLVDVLVNISLKLWDCDEKA